MEFIIPNEILDEIKKVPVRKYVFERAGEEPLELVKYSDYERLQNIIKEVRGKLKNELDNYNVTMGRALKIELLEILDKEYT